MTIEPIDLAYIPEPDRRIIARWLVQRSNEVMSPMAKLLYGEVSVGLVRDSLLGAAVDLVDPLSDDASIEHATQVLKTLR